MPIPTVVEKQAEEAEKLYKEMYPDKDTPEGIPPPAPEKVEEETPKVVEPEPEPESEVIEPVKEPEVTIDSLQVELNDLLAKYGKLQKSHDVLKGKYNAEIKSEVPDLREQIESLMQENESLKANLVEIPKSEIKLDKTNESIKRVTEEYGEDFIKDIIGIVKPIIANEMTSTVRPLEERVEGIHRESTLTAQQRYITDLSGAVSDWREIKDNPEFMVFLEGRDPFSGYSFYDLASDAEQKKDARRMANFYLAFKELAGGNNKGSPSTKKDKSGLIAPPSKPKASSHEPEKVYYTTTQLQQFANDVVHGLYKGKEKEQQAKQVEFDKATQEGRLIAG